MWALFRLRGLPGSPGQTVAGFFSTPPFVLLDEEPGRELVSGVLLPGPGVRPPASPAAFREALRTAPFAAVATFRADPADAGSILWTETWARTRGAPARWAFAAYWLAIGPWSAWIRRMLLRGARRALPGAARR